MSSEIEAKPALRLLRPDEIPHVLEEGEMGCALEWAVTDPKTGVVREHVVKRSESYVRQFLDLLYAIANNASQEYPIVIRDSTNTLRNVLHDTNDLFNRVPYTLDVQSAVGTATSLCVGTGAVAPTINDYALGTTIAHGAGGGQMQYGAVTFGLPGNDATTAQFTITRNFTANAGGITVNEIGLYARARESPNTERWFLIIRDVIGGGIVVPAGQTLTINYRPQVTI